MTIVPGVALVGEKLVIVGAGGGGGGIKLNPPRTAVSLLTMTLTLPEEPAPTTALMVLAFTTEKESAGVPPKLTVVAPIKPEPVMTTEALVVALAGAKPVMAGAGGGELE